MSKLQSWLDPVRLAQVLLQQRVRLVLAWLLAGLAGFTAIYYAWDSFSSRTRPDGNHGHTAVDFGGQWLMGRMIVEGLGPHLYVRNYHRGVLEKAYPRSDEAPEQSRDAEDLLGQMMGSDDPVAPDVVASFAATLAAPDPLQLGIVVAAGQNSWTPERLAHITTPRRGGPLYPPTHALLFAPLATLKPLIAYRIAQLLNLALIFVCGLMVSRISQGRMWWPMAALGLMMIPGYGGSINLGQNATYSLALLLVGWRQLLLGRPEWAGVCWGFLAYKPVWAVAFFPVPLLMRRWRFALAMALTGVTLVLATLPLVGWAVWLSWLENGRDAAGLYAKYTNWIYLSRDLNNLPLRWLVDLPPEGPPENYWSRLAEILGQILWLSVMGITLVLGAWRWRPSTPLVGPAAAFLLLGAWLSCLHFMFYDTLLAACGVSLLFAEPGRFLDLAFVRCPGPLPEGLRAYYQPIPDFQTPPMPLLPDGQRWRWVWNAVPPTVLTIMIAGTYIYQAVDPSYHFPPIDTYLLLILWGWCGWRWLRDEGLSSA